MEAQLKGAVLIALVVVPQWRCPILKPLSAKLPPKSETAPHPGWQDGTILEPGSSSSLPTFLANCLLSFVMMSTAVGDQPLKVSTAIGRKVKPSAALLSSYFFDFNS